MAWPKKIGPMKYKSPAQRTAVVLAEQERHGKRKKRPQTVAQMLGNRFDPQFGIKESEQHKFKPFGTTPFGEKYRPFGGYPFESSSKIKF